MADVAVPPPTNGTSLPTTTDENAVPNGESTATTSAAATEGGENVTVFHDPNNFNVKHPLMNQWTFWFTKPPSGKVCTPHFKPGDTVLVVVVC